MCLDVNYSYKDNECGYRSQGCTQLSYDGHNECL